MVVVTGKGRVVVFSAGVEVKMKSVLGKLVVIFKALVVLELFSESREIACLGCSFFLSLNIYLAEVWALSMVQGGLKVENFKL